jgi:hypothetical protein
LEGKGRGEDGRGGRVLLRHLAVPMAVATLPACCSQGSASARSVGAWGGIEE